MQLQDIDEDQNKSAGKMATLEPTQGNIKDQRRGSSSLLAAAGIGYEQRRKSSMQTQQDARVYQQGNQVKESSMSKRRNNECQLISHYEFSYKKNFFLISMHTVNTFTQY